MFEAADQETVKLPVLLVDGDTDMELIGPGWGTESSSQGKLEVPADEVPDIISIGSSQPVVCDAAENEANKSVRPRKRIRPCGRAIVKPVVIVLFM